MFVCDGGKVGWPTLTEIKRPERAIVLSLPIASDQTWTPSEGMKELRRSEFHRLIEDHNAALQNGER